MAIPTTPRTVSHHVFTLGGRIDLIRRMIARDFEDPQVSASVRALAGRLVGRCPIRGDVGQRMADFCELTSIYDWIVDNIRYTGDIGPGYGHPALDLYQSPWRTIQMALQNGSAPADCDCVIAVAVLLLRFLGWHVWARVSSQNGREWQHIYPVVAFDKLTEYRQIVFDTTLGHDKLGQEAPKKRWVDYEV